MTDATDALLPCPFCGATAHMHEIDWCEPAEWSAGCGECFAQTRSRPTRATAALEWNRRALLAGNDEVARLREALECILHCTPFCRTQDNHIIEFDCGNPFDIARAALEPGNG